MTDEVKPATDDDVMEWRREIFHLDAGVVRRWRDLDTQPLVIRIEQDSARINAKNKQIAEQAETIATLTQQIDTADEHARVSGASYRKQIEEMRAALAIMTADRDAAVKRIAELVVERQSMLKTIFATGKTPPPTVELDALRRELAQVRESCARQHITREQAVEIAERNITQGCREAFGVKEGE